jgi:glutathione S-transferase
MGSIAQLKPLKLYSHKKGPNPWKVAVILEELAIPYVTEYMEFEDTKVEPYVLLNPNGKLPVLEDPNRDIVLFEVSCAKRQIRNCSSVC